MMQKEEDDAQYSVNLIEMHTKYIYLLTVWNCNPENRAFKIWFKLENQKRTSAISRCMIGSVLHKIVVFRQSKEIVNLNECRHLLGYRAI
jgi:hypothetical protein